MERKILGSVTIPKYEYLDLLIDSETLLRLNAGGVDNWEGYSDSMNSDGYSIDDFTHRTIRELKQL